ncbi:Ig-like domain-containing protein [Anaerosporobacter faecicola]|uniref:Ig-like domain-containing protein n=1 Tax=Anaerosporobacter faecicola TaxID=2718714 RepID=UPI001438BD70|nr:Ig-like domain-containing protein [Anaerosporobacter faecicola]
MKKRLSLLLTIIIVISLVIPKVGQAYEVLLNATEVVLYPGDTFQMDSYRVCKKIKWSSEDKKVAKVSKKGLIKAVKIGETRIIAKSDGKKYYVKVKVIDKVKSYKVEIKDGVMKLTYTPNFSFEEFQPIAIFYDKDDNVVGKLEFCNSFVTEENVKMIEDKEIPVDNYDRYEIIFVTTPD